MPETLLEARKITKTFPGVRALDGVDFSLLKGEIHTLLGENGSGKSTLFRTMAGIYRPDAGQILVDGKPVGEWNPSFAERRGISIIHQELSLFPDLTVAENILLEHESFVSGGLVRWKRVNEKAREILDYLRARDIQTWDRVESLSVAQRQIVEIAKALAASKVRVLLMDEPTSALSLEETKILFDIMRRLRADGVGIIFISHKLDEVFAVSDRVTVLRDGRYVGTERIQDITQNDLIRMMVGRDLGDMSRRRASHCRDETLLEVRRLSRAGRVKEASLSLKCGEILGIFGLVGAGRTELAEALFGIARPSGGEILLEGKPVHFADSAAAMAAGIGLIPEDRGLQGLVLPMSLYENATLPIVDRLFPSRVLSRSREKRESRRVFSELDVRYHDVSDCVDTLSGGNKQKVVLAKWLLTGAKVLIFDEPTKGVDVGAKDVIHQLMDKLAADGMGIVMISSEMPEILKMSDRVLVMCEGETVGELSAAEATQDAIMQLASPK